MRSTLLSFSVLILVAVNAFAQTGEFTYQGRLVAGGSAANTPHDFEFRLCASEMDCVTPLEAKQRPGIPVSNGIFTVKLDFDAAHFNGADRWLEIAVRPAGGGTFATLSPLQRVTSAPYSIKSLNAESAITATNATQLGGVAANQYVVTTDPRMTDARPPAPGSDNYIQNNPLSQQLSGNFNIGGNGTAWGTLSGGVVNTFTQFEINGVRVLRMDGTGSSLYGGVSGPIVPTGDLNTFFGMGVGLINAGHRNSFFGNLSGNANQGGAYNSFFGVAAGENNVSGNENTAVGFRARPGQGDLTNATAIGANAQVNQSNSLVLGSIAGVNEATADTKVGIGTTSPTEKLHVVGNVLVTGVITGNGSGLSNLSPSSINGPISENQVNLAGAIFSGRISGLLTGGAAVQSGGAIAYTNATNLVNGGDVKILSPNRTCIATNLHAKTTEPPGESNRRDIALRVNGSITVLQCGISGTSTACASGAQVTIGPGSELWMNLFVEDGGVAGDVGGTAIMFGWECR